MSVFTKRELIRPPRLSLQQRLEATLALMAAGIELYRACERQRHPDLDDADIDARVREYLAAEESPDPALRPRTRSLGD